MVAGRSSLVRSLHVLQICAGDDAKGCLLIVDVVFKVAICHQLSIKVAAWDTRIKRSGRGRPTQMGEAWQKVGDILLDKGVRIVAGEFYSALRSVVYHLRRNLSIRVAATHLFENLLPW